MKVNKFGEVVCPHGWVLGWKPAVGAYATGAVGAYSTGPSACPGKCVLPSNEYDKLINQS